MTREWDATTGNGGEDVLGKVSLHCLGRGVPARTWLKLAHQSSVDGNDERSRDRLAATLLSCLRANPSVTGLVLNYVDVGLQGCDSADHDARPLCTPASFFRALLDDSQNVVMPMAPLQGLCGVLRPSSDNTPALFTVQRCTAAVLLLRHGCETGSNNKVVDLASNLLSAFCSVLELKIELDDDEKAACAATIQTTLKEQPQGPIAQLLSRLLALVQTVSGGQGIQQKKQPDQPHLRWESHDAQKAFLSMLQKAHDGPTWSADHPDSPVPTSLRVQPEIANLLHWLVDDYSTWQCKLDAARMLLAARFDHADAKVQAQFYLELLHGAASACAAIAGTPASLGGDDDYTSVWRSVLCGMLPSIMESLSTKEGEHTVTDCMAAAVQSLLSDPSQVMAGCEVVLASNEEKRKKRGAGSGADEEADMMLDVFIGADDGPARQPVRAALIRSLEDKRLLRREDWKMVQGHESVLNDMSLLGESFLSEIEGQFDASFSSSTTDLDSLLEQKLTGGDALEDGELLGRFKQDYSCQYAFAQAVIKFSLDSIIAGELDSLSRVCKAFTHDLLAVDILLLYVCPAQILQPFAGLLNDSDLLQNGEDPSGIGAILLFVQLILQKGLGANFNLEDLLPRQEFLACFIRSSCAVQLGSRLASSEQVVVSNWITALFGSEGISDELISSSSPQLLLRITPTLFNQSITACCSGVIDSDTLRGGLTYFLQDLLSYTLPSALAWLLCDLSRCKSEEALSIVQDEASKSQWAKARAIRLEVLSMLLLSETCPSIVQTLVANRAVQVLDQFDSSEAGVDLGALKSAMQGQAESSRESRTHLWIAVAQRSMTSCNVDSLLGLDASLSALVGKRGAKVSLQATFDSLLLHPKSPHLARAVAVSLCLATLQRAPDTGLVDEVLVEFARQTMLPGYSVKSAVDSLHLALAMLMAAPGSLSSAARLHHVVDAVQAIVALQVRRQLRKARAVSDVARITRTYGILFHAMPSKGLLFTAPDSRPPSSIVTATV